MSDPLYRLDVLRLAADATGAGRLANPHGSYMAHNPACSDRTTVDVTVEDGRIKTVAHDTQACVLAQASASILGGTLPSHSLDELEKLRADVAGMLGGGDAPKAPFSAYGVLREVGGYPSRHNCVLLPIEAALKAFAASQKREPAT
jgi:nitrogen fixation NifU-like protein